MLIECGECGKEISDRAEACPNCGNPISSNNRNFKLNEVYKHLKKKYPINKIIAVISIILVISIGVFVISNVSDNSVKSQILGEWSFNYGTSSRPKYTFSSNGTYSESFIRITGSPSYDSGTYKIEGNTIFLDNSKTNKIEIINIIDEHTMRVKVRGTEGTFTRIK